MNIIKKILIIFTLLITTTLSVNSYANEKAGCGIIYDGNSTTGVSVDPESFEICEQDIGFKFFYIIFGDMLENEKAHEIVSSLVDIPKATVELKELAGISPVISGIYKSIIYMVLVALIPFIIYQSLKYIYISKTTGNFLGENSNRKVEVVAQIVIFLILVSPVGNILVIQLLIFIMAILSMMIANFFLGNFLYQTGVKSANVTIDEGELLYNSYDFAKSITSQELCKSRTSKTILNNRVRENSNWVKESPRLTLSDNTMGDFNELNRECLKYTSVGKVDAKYDGVARINYLKPEMTNCDDQDITYSDIQYYPEDFGYPHSCGSIDYVWPNKENFIKENDGVNDEIDEVYKYINNSSFKYTWSASNHINYFHKNYYGSINSIVKDKTLKDQDKEIKLKEVFDKYSNELLSKISNDSNLSTRYTNVDEAQGKANIIYLTHMAATNYMLGANQKNKTDFEELNYYTKGKELYFGYDEIRKYAVKASDSLEMYNCALNWKDKINTRKTFLVYSEMSDDKDLSDFIEKTSNFKDFECFKYIQNNDSPHSNKMKFLFEDTTYMNDYFGDIKDKKTFEMISDQKIINDLNNKFKNEISIDILKDAESNIVLLAGYNYAVKKAIITNMSNQLKKATDHNTLVNTRQMGWAGFASMLLSISGQMVNALQFANSIEGTAVASNEKKGDLNAEMFLDDKAFLNSSEEKVNTFEMLPKMKLAAIFGEATTKNINSKASVTVADVENESNMLDDFKNLIILKIESPIKYIKMGGGLDPNKTLSEGLKDCNVTGTCISTQTHPLNAMMLFGHDLIDNVMDILILKIITDLMIAGEEMVTEKLTKKFSGVSENSSFNKIAKLLVKGGGFILQLVMGLVKAINAILSFFQPLWFVLIGLGIFCGYLIPVIPYLMSTLVIISWFISIFIISLISVVWLIKLGNVKEDGSTDINLNSIWQITGNILINPPLLTIGLIFAWSLSTVTIYFINSTMFIILSSTTNISGGFISSIVAYIVTYILYVIILYVAIQHSFQIIGKFSDEVSNVLGVSGAGNSSSLQNLQLEKLLGAALASKIVNDLMLEKGMNPSEKVKKNAQRKFAEKKRKKSEAQKALEAQKAQMESESALNTKIQQ